MNKNTVFNPEYTFDTFEENANNCLMAYCGAMAVAENPLFAYNPFFLCGSSEPNKKHLMHAMGNYITANHPSMHMAYVPGEELENKLREAASNENSEIGITDTVYEEYKSADVIFFDDLQYFVNDEELQTALLCILDKLFQDDKQIIVSSRMSVNDLPGLKELLKHKYEWSLVADIA